ncbi:uncharacterized protein LOC141904719 [Tubulanus polymorphus]|uniref:uncharacterized protein LOC141904719 n=1 Tax=Tubulanus polymorphus TaxID=672921 RepID=UPI003DA46051
MWLSFIRRPVITSKQKSTLQMSQFGCMLRLLYVSLRAQKSFASIRYFIDRFPCIGQDLQTDILQMEFVEFQSTRDSDLPTDLYFIKNADGSERCRPMEQQWNMIAKEMKDLNQSCRFKQLPVVMKRILLIPVSNASCERVFSTVKTNRTMFRGSMLPATLESLMILKARGGECYNFEPSNDLLKKAKSAAYKSLNPADE